MKEAVTSSTAVSVNWEQVQMVFLVRHFWIKSWSDHQLPGPRRHFRSPSRKDGVGSIDQRKEGSPFGVGECHARNSTEGLPCMEGPKHSAAFLRSSSKNIHRKLNDKPVKSRWEKSLTFCKEVGKSTHTQTHSQHHT